ncbi:hypothetical protein GCM10009127_29140 [Alteraurantiacibacter aestuarii]
MAEQFGFDQRFGQGRTIERDQRFFPAVGQAMQALGNQFLARSPLSDDKDWPRHRRCPTGAFDRIKEGP